MTNVSLTSIFLRFLAFGCTAWGGPAAQLAALREEYVERRKWTDDDHFRRAYGVYQCLPGPEAHEMCCWLGAVARGRRGALAAGLGFMLPGFLLMLLAAWAYATLLGPEGVASHARLDSAFTAVHAAVLALIAVAVQRLSRKMVSPLAASGGWFIAATALILQVQGAPFWVALVTGGVAHALVRVRVAVGMAVLPLVIAIVWTVSPAATPIAPMSPSPATESSAPPTQATLLRTGLVGGLTSFGGAYTAIPIVRAEAVPSATHAGWMTDRAFLDGVAIASVLPAPLVIFGTFVGFLGGGWIGAVVFTIGMFLPAFSFTLIGHHFLERLTRWPPAHAVLDGVACAACGLVAATWLELAVPFGRLHLAQPERFGWCVLIFLVAGAALTFTKQRFVVPLVVVASAIVGALAGV